MGSFVRDVFTTRAGWTLIVAGVGVGFLFALLVLTISVVSFPMLLDRDVGLATTVATSIRTWLTNLGPMAVGGLSSQAPGHRVDTSAHRSHHRHARARARHQAPISQGCSVLTSIGPELWPATERR
jgi:hypothetical protein